TRCLTRCLYTSSAPTSMHPLPLHDALPICLRAATPVTEPCDRRRGCASTRAPSSARAAGAGPSSCPARATIRCCWTPTGPPRLRSEEHTSELQSRGHLVCRLLLEKKKTNAL